MPEIRTNKILASGGFKKTGKTYQTYKLISKYLSPNDGSSPRKCLVFDTNFEYNASSIVEAGFNFHIKTIKLSDLPKFILQQKVEAARILPLLPNGEIMTSQKKDTAWKIVQDSRGMLVVLEDPNTYVLQTTFEEALVFAIVNNGHRNLDICMNFQSINMISPVILRNLNECRLHYESTLPSKEKFAEKWELFMIGKFIVDAKFHSGNETFCVHVDNLRFKIKGNFTQQEYALACKKYIESFATRLVRQEMNKVSGTPQEKYAKAMAQACRGLFIYWGN